MNLIEYKGILKNTVELEMPNYLRQKLIYAIKENKIGKYGADESDEIINLTGMANHQSRINKCLDRNDLTIKLIDLLDISRGYRYSIIYKYDNINFDVFKRNLEMIADNITSEYYKYEVKKDQILYYEDEDALYIKFHKSIEVLDKKNLQRRYVRYPILFVFHKKM
ncbi:MAG: hypothetical protein ACRC7N_16390, partial [Clostridium sp.]